MAEGQARRQVTVESAGKSVRLDGIESNAEEVVQPMAISRKQQRHLTTLAHPMKPVVSIGQAGLTEGVLNELEQTLKAHELIKVRVNAGDRELRDRMIQRICAQRSCELVQRIGHVAVLYRENPKKKNRIALPRA